MSSDNGDRKRTGLAGQIEIEITRDLSSSEEVSLYQDGASALSILYQVVEQAEELEHATATSEPGAEALTPAHMQQQIARLHKHNSALKKILTKLH
jgi:hypothetical protein